MGLVWEEGGYWEQALAEYILSPASSISLLFPDSREVGNFATPWSSPHDFVPHCGWKTTEPLTMNLRNENQNKPFLFNLFSGVGCCKVTT